jgi:hypothetical protein
MTTYRMLPSPVVDEQTRIVNGRSFSGAPGAAYDIVDCDANTLEANGWTFVALSGPTSARPLPALTPIGPEGTQAGPGEKFFDTTLNALIVCDGATWRSPIDGSAV